MSKSTNLHGVEYVLAGLIVGVTIAGTAAAAIPILFVDAIVVVQLWAWFVAEPFGVVQIGMAHAVGIKLIWPLLTKTEGVSFREEKKEPPMYKGKMLVGAYLVRLFVAPSIALLVGYVLHGWMK